MQVSVHLKLTAISFTVKKSGSSNRQGHPGTAEGKGSFPCFQRSPGREETPTLHPFSASFGPSNYSYLPFPHLLLAVLRYWPLCNANDRSSKTRTKAESSLFTELMATILKKLQTGHEHLNPLIIQSCVDSWISSATAVWTHNTEQGWSALYQGHILVFWHLCTEMT